MYSNELSGAAAGRVAAAVMNAAAKPRLLYATQTMHDTDCRDLFRASPLIFFTTQSRGNDTRADAS